jgi:hypothetical protein
MSRPRSRWLGALTATTIVCQAFGGYPSLSTANIEPKADEVLQNMSKYLAAAARFRFKAHDMVDEVLDNGQKIQFSNTRTIAVRRPDKVISTITGDLENRRAWYDGTTLAILDLNDNVYWAGEVPSNIDAMLDYVAEHFGVTLPLADLVFSDPYEAVIGGVRSGRYVGLHKVSSIECHHLAFQQDAIDWQIWIDSGDKPLPRKVVITYKALPGQPQYIAIFDEWNLSPQLPDELFVFEPPKGAEKIELMKIGTAPVPETGSAVPTPTGDETP